MVKKLKALFVHDNKFIKYRNDCYSYAHFSYESLWKYYLEFFEELCIVGRISETDNEKEIKDLCISDAPSVSFIACPNLMSPEGMLKRKEARNILEKELEKADVAIIRVPSMLGSMAADIAKKQRKPYVVEVVGCAWDSLWNYGNLSGRIAAFPSWLQERRVVRTAPYAVYVSRHFLQKRYPNRHKNIDLPDCRIRKTEDTVLKQRLERIDAESASNEFRLGFVASAHAAYKGQETAIRALKRVSDQIPDVKLCILGDGDYSRWMNIAKDLQVDQHIRLCGTINELNGVLEWFDTIDIYLMPSLQETLGRSLIEAMSRGCPALGTRETAIPEQLGDDCLFSVKDDKDLADKIMFMYTHLEYRKLCARENFYRAQKYANEQISVKRKEFWNDFLEDVISERNSKSDE